VLSFVPDVIVGAAAFPRRFPAPKRPSAGFRRRDFLRKCKGIRETRRVAMLSHLHNLAALQEAP